MDGDFKQNSKESAHFKLAKLPANLSTLSRNYNSAVQCSLTSVILMPLWQCSWHTI